MATQLFNTIFFRPTLSAPKAAALLLALASAAAQAQGAGPGAGGGAGPGPGPAAGTGLAAKTEQFVERQKEALHKQTQVRTQEKNLADTHSQMKAQEKLLKQTREQIKRQDQLLVRSRAQIQDHAQDKPEVLEQLRKMGAAAVDNTPAEFAAEIQSDIKTYKTVAMRMLSDAELRELAQHEFGVVVERLAVLGGHHAARAAHR